MNAFKFRIASILTLTGLLAGCGSNVPLTETKPAEPVKTVDVAPAPAPAANLVTGNFYCEMGNRIALASDAGGAVKLTWKGRAYPMTAASTSTGAVRLEDKSSGLVWIQIPAKSMLLNTKSGQQLANECKLR
ncbi:hypothetical protein [Paraherbaspirillum soli]|uniref:C-type lysozyme inhibitor domain-containing protein n=1 Tax=Paraherbaspirillum soli TaxID=631222 RepID=A0ABW0M4T7_9BURK